MAMSPHRASPVVCEARSVDLVAVSLVRGSLYTVQQLEPTPLTLGLIETQGDVGGNMETSREGTLSARARLVMQDHVVGGSVVFPGVGYVEMALAQHAIGEGAVVRNVAFIRIWVLAAPRRAEEAPGSGTDV